MSGAQDWALRAGSRLVGCREVEDSRSWQHLEGIRIRDKGSEQSCPAVTTETWGKATTQCRKDIDIGDGCLGLDFPQ